MMASKKSSLTDRFLPTLVLVSVVLAFAVGVLWQKVSDLEGGRAATGTNAVAGAEQAAGAQAPSVLNDLTGLADASGVDTKDFEKCVADGKFADKVESQYQSGLQVGITGTPGTVVINSQGDAWLVSGALPYENLKTVLDDALGTGDGTATGKLDAVTAGKLAPVSGDDHVQGSRNAQVYMVEYSDFQCPYCQRFHPTVMQALDEYDDKVALVYRHFPLDQIHPLARPAAVASECIADLGGEDAFWKFADLAFGN